ncbi:MAG: substrate-binding domain-containing protein [Candidatus Thiodiazotropha endolucinida]
MFKAIKAGLAVVLLLAGEAWSAQYLIGFAQDTLGNDWRLAQVKAVERELSKHPNVRFIYTDGQGDTALQIKHIEDLVAQGIDLLITSPRDKLALSRVVQHVHEQGIPVVLLSRNVETTSYTTFVHIDDRQIAMAAAEYIARLLDGKGTVLILEGIPSASTAIQRTESFLEVMSNHSGIKLIRRVGNYLRSDAIVQMESLLATGQQIDAIYAHSDSMATGARMALKLHGIDPRHIPIVGIDYISEAQQAIREGEQLLSYTYPTGGEEGARAAVKILSGEVVPKEILLNSIPVTRENVETVEPVF